MVNTAGEASSSQPEKQPVDSPIIDNGANESENAGGDMVAQSVMLCDVDVLQCPICCNPLSLRIFQCQNGHIACSDCCMKIRNKCPFCTLPIGNIRNRNMERVLEAIIFQCSNVKRGCTETFSYGKKLAHEKGCGFAICYCPAPNCNYTGVYRDLYNHYYAKHSDNDPWKSVNSCQDMTSTWLRISEKMHVVQEDRDDGPLVVVQCFKETQGMFVTVNCIAPLAARGKELYHYDHYDLSYTLLGNTMTFRSDEIKKILKVSFETPGKNFMFVPYYFLDLCPELKMKLCIHKVIKSEEEESSYHVIGRRSG